jgi:hypothetical protein
MSTIFALVIMFACFTFGLALIGLVVLVMGVGGLPGALIFEAGRKSSNKALLLLGVAATAVGQSYIVCAYSAFVVSALRAFSGAYEQVPTWPLWIAAFFHSCAPTAYAKKERFGVPTSQNLALGIAGFAAFVCFVVMVVNPAPLHGVFGWVPFFAANAKG